ncbi:hypothetical protein FB451DRAFT_1172072 [Mycena latifolia]|nr:hypothetical protein FB451DRAFT_1172072 [Mycena latifolia]
MNSAPLVADLRSLLAAHVTFMDQAPFRILATSLWTQQYNQFNLDGMLEVKGYMGRGYIEQSKFSRATDHKTKRRTLAIDGSKAHMSRQKVSIGGEQIFIRGWREENLMQRVIILSNRRARAPLGGTGYRSGIIPAAILGSGRAIGTLDRGVGLGRPATLLIEGEGEKDQCSREATDVFWTEMGGPTGECDKAFAVVGRPVSAEDDPAGGGFVGETVEQGEVNKRARAEPYGSREINVGDKYVLGQPEYETEATEATATPSMRRDMEGERRRRQRWPLRYLSTIESVGRIKGGGGGGGNLCSEQTSFQRGKRNV